MRVYLLAKELGSELVEILNEDIRFASDRVEQFKTVADLVEALAKERPELIVIELERAHPIAPIREAAPHVAILAVSNGEAGASIRQAGADEVIDRSVLNQQTFGKAVERSRERRREHLIEIHLLESVQLFGESLAGEEEVDIVVERVLSEAVAQTRADFGYLISEWQDGLSVERAHAFVGRDFADEISNRLSSHPEFSPLIREEGRHLIGTDELLDLRSDLGDVASLLVVRFGKCASWGRGGMVLAHSRPNAFSERDVRAATGLASWAGVAIKHASIIRDRSHAIEVRERVLAVASHDLRNPLSVFNMALELLVDTEDADERFEIVERAQRSVATMRRLISDLLDYAALDAGNLTIERAASNARAIAQRALDGIEHLAKRKGLTQKLVADDAMFSTVDVDPGRIEQSLTNLLTNAIKFTPKGGAITLSISQSEVTTTFTVSDTGPGIDEEQQRRLFERYYTRARSGSGKGIGLGLSIARGIAEGHRGTLLVDSTLGEGSNFLLTVPNRSETRR